MGLKAISARRVKRIQIQTLSREGISIKKISEKLSVSESTVKLWKNRSSIVDKPTPTKLDSYTKRFIKIKLYRKNDSSIRKTTDALNQSKTYAKQGKILSTRTVQRYVKSTPWGKKAFKTPYKPKL